MKITKNIRLYLSIFIVWLFLLLSVLFTLIQIDAARDASEDLLKQSILQEASAHFKNIIDARKWNASHGGVFVRDNGTLKPNPYLIDNTLKTDDNQTLIKINPAWMTRQISEIANKDNDYYYKLTSLRPLNPDNQADAFEKKALEYFERNKDVRFYHVLSHEKDGSHKFDFMGSLKVTPNCMGCHEYQGYKVGDIRGGVRVSLPTKIYDASLKALNGQDLRDKFKMVFLAFVIGFLITFYLLKSLSYEREIKELNKNLEEKVARRTKELREINATLEERVLEEVQKNRLKDAAALTQSKHIAMSEMIRTLAHQWRQPLATMDMSIGNILVDVELGEADAETIGGSLAKIKNLSQIISSFSDVFDTDSSKKFVKAEDILQDALSTLNANARAYSIEIEKSFASETKLEIVPKNLFQVYWNILNNAIEILGREKTINPKIRIVIEENESEIITRVSDNGGGIEDAKLDEIFEPYYSTDSNLNGKGLGLYISKTIARQELGGSIVASNNEFGADFTIRLPKSPRVVIG
jgi:signal transduction histidine kinase